jgi:hypothetical protein
MRVKFNYLKENDMIPRAVQMAKEITSLMGASLEADLGNVLGPVSRKGWSNNFSQWYLGGPESLGRPTMYTHRIHRWVDGQPMWSQRPQKRFGVGYNAIMVPVADSPIAPPTTVLSIPE